MTVRLSAIRSCLDGAVPGTIATCARDGTPNVSYVSQLQYVDEDHVGLSFQFFNKTRENVLANPWATALVIEPHTGAQYRLSLEYLRTETAGALFETMKARLAGIASHTGMSGVFRLLGADVYRVHGIERVSGGTAAAPLAARNPLAAVRACAGRLAACSDLATLLDELLAALEQEFGIRHAMVLMYDAGESRLYTVASRGYDASGVGSEIRLGDGVIGVAAAQRTAIRITHTTSEYGYGRAVRESVRQDDPARALDIEIPFPGLLAPGSQLAVPIVLGDCLLGVLHAESEEDGRFGYDEEDALVAVAAQVALGIRLAQQAADAHVEARADAVGPPSLEGGIVRVRHFAVNDSVFLDEDYLIKGVAGAIFWKLVRDHVQDGRTEFSNRELRLDPAIRLPELAENLEARLVLLQRRLAERCAFVRIEKTGRGRFRLCVNRPLQLVDVDAA
jgi:adenylate cyclase